MFFVGVHGVSEKGQDNELVLYSEILDPLSQILESYLYHF